MKLKFLGTGGGRFVTGMQRRKTGGILVKTDETQIHVDPGPGALVETHEQDNPEETEAVIVSHAHLDHVNDANAIIEMMVEGYDKRGTVFASKSVLEGHGDIEQYIDKYHKDLAGRVEILSEGEEYKFRDLTIRSQEMFHSDPKTQGFVLETEEKSVGFWTDTEYSDELTGLYEGCDTMVIYCGRPRNQSVPTHTSPGDVPDIVEGSEVSTVIITHFGYKFLDGDIEEQKEWLEEQIDAKVVFADDGIEFPGNRSLGDF